jgi:hypothetical protein
MARASRKRKARHAGRAGAKARKKKPPPPSRARRGVAPDCLDPPEALVVIRACLGGILPGLETPLGQLFPSPERRKQFCRSVGKSVSAPVPCGAGTTLQEIFDAISC